MAYVNIAETERLRLRHMELADAQFVLRLLNEPSWLENIGDRGVGTLANAEEYIRTKIQEMYKTLGFGMYLVESKLEGKPIGVCGLVKREGLKDPDLGFALLPEFWGKGYAFEAASAAMHYARLQLALDNLFAIVTPTNPRSISLLERLGFVHRGSFRISPEDKALRLYAFAAHP